MDSTRLTQKLDALGPAALAILRVMTGLLFMQHGFQKLFHWPPGGHHTGPLELLSMVGIAGILEFFGGFLVAIGLFTRPVAFLLSGQMAVAYFAIHLASNLSKPWGYIPVVNSGDLAILYCFIFFLFVFTGPGPFSVDQARARTSQPLE